MLVKVGATRMKQQIFFSDLVAEPLKLNLGYIYRPTRRHYKAIRIGYKTIISCVINTGF